MMEIGMDYREKRRCPMCDCNCCSVDEHRLCATSICVTCKSQTVHAQMIVCTGPTCLPSFEEEKDFKPAEVLEKSMCGICILNHFGHGELKPALPYAIDEANQRDLAGFRTVLQGELAKLEEAVEPERAKPYREAVDVFLKHTASVLPTAGSVNDYAEKLEKAAQQFRELSSYVDKILKLVVDANDKSREAIKFLEGIDGSGQRKEVDQMTPSLAAKKPKMDNSEAVVELVECPVCLKSIYQSNVFPVVGTCGHSFCSDCTNDISRTTRLCPLCNSRSFDEHSLRKNYTLCDALELSFAVKKEKEAVTGQCVGCQTDVLHSQMLICAADECAPMGKEGGKSKNRLQPIDVLKKSLCAICSLGHVDHRRLTAALPYSIRVACDDGMPLFKIILLGNFEALAKAVGPQKEETAQSRRDRIVQAVLDEFNAMLCTAVSVTDYEKRLEQVRQLLREWRSKANDVVLIMDEVDELINVGFSSC